jgi:hypothetical protein
LKLPIVVTTTARDSMWGPTFPELVEALPGIDIIDRSSVNAFDDARVARAIEATGRKKLIFAGISLEVCAAFPAITAVGKGLDAYVAVDASGTFSETKRQVGLLRMLQAGVIVSDYATLMVEILKDNARPEAGDVYAAMDMPWATLVGQVARAGQIARPPESKPTCGRPTNVDRLASLMRFAGRFSPRNGTLHPKLWMKPYVREDITERRQKPRRPRRGDFQSPVSNGIRATNPSPKLGKPPFCHWNYARSLSLIVLKTFPYSGLLIVLPLRLNYSLSFFR